MNLKDIPRSVDLEIVSALINYSVAICRVRDDNPNTFTPLGSGTFVIRNGLYGVLTAYHCLHACAPEVSIGAQGKDKLLLMVTRSRCITLDPTVVREHTSAIPESDEFGPDLTFLEILSGPELGWLKAIVSFWNLDQKHYDLARKLSGVGVLIVEAGFPQTEYHTRISRSVIYHELKYIVFVGALGDEDISEREGWDYIKSNCQYRASEKLPETFKGVSGGGIWAVRLLLRNGDQWTIERDCLVGVAFYESKIVDNMKEVKGHFIRAIYETVWN